ncbi:MAG: NUDIX hydrolase [Pirellulaceae bacterium]|nr:NUDIX hydrolase [Pirellulaceae bacterium]
MPSAKKVFRARRFDVEEVYQPLDDGTFLPRHVVRHPGAVVVLPIVDENHVCLIHTYRVAVDQWMLELPAGTLEPNEAPMLTAGRELIEETGYEAAKMDKVHIFRMSPGILDEKMHFFVASQLSYTKPRREVGEQISNRVLSWSEIDRYLRDGLIEDAKTLVALLWYLRYRIHA